MLAAIADISQWGFAHKLKLNPDKSEVISRVNISVGRRNLTQYTLERPPQSFRVAFICRNLTPPVIVVLFFVQ